MRHPLLAAFLVAASCVSAEPEASRAGAFDERPLRADASVSLIGTHIWRQSDEHFGGFSAIEVDPDGAGFIALTDRSFLFEGRFLRDASEAIIGIEDGPRHQLLDQDGNPMRRPRIDSEGLAVAPDGTIYIAFEGVTRVRRQMGVDGDPELLPAHPDFARLPRNESLEALAIGPDGALYAIPERPLGGPDAPFPVYRFRDEAWDIAFTLPRRGRFLVTGADIGPDGRLYVLERDFLGIGFRTRVRRFDLDGGAEVVLLETPLGRLDNMEGISIWGEVGDMRMTLIADNNFNPLQRNLIAEYSLPD